MKGKGKQALNMPMQNINTMMAIPNSSKVRSHTPGITNLLKEFLVFSLTSDYLTFRGNCLSHKVLLQVENSTLNALKMHMQKCGPFHWLLGVPSTDPRGNYPPFLSSSLSQALRPFSQSLDPICPPCHQSQAFSCSPAVHSPSPSVSAMPHSPFLSIHQSLPLWPSFPVPTVEFLAPSPFSIPLNSPVLPYSPAP